MHPWRSDELTIATLPLCQRGREPSEPARKQVIHHQIRVSGGPAIAHLQIHLTSTFNEVINSTKALQTLTTPLKNISKRAKNISHRVHCDSRCARWGCFSPETVTIMEIITRYELRVILKICGYSQAAFSRFIGRSEAYVSHLCWRTDKPIPLRWIDLLQSMIGEDVFETAVPMARKMIEEARSRRGFI